MIHVIATIKCKPGQRDAVLAEFRQIIPAVHAEAGCIEYGPAVDSTTDIETQHKLGDDQFMVIEKWQDITALKAHSQAEHMLSYRQKVGSMLIGSEICILDSAT